MEFKDYVTTCSNEDYCSSILCLGAQQRTPSSSSVAFYDVPRKDWAVCIFLYPGAIDAIIRYQIEYHVADVMVVCVAEYRLVDVIVMALQNLIADVSIVCSVVYHLADVIVVCVV